MLRSSLAGCLALALISCGGTSSVPTSPGPPAPPAAPKAVLRIDSGSPALGVSGFTPFVFDASSSTGDGLSYLIDFGDDAVSTDAVTSHTSQRGGRAATARLTVTDRLGRTDSATQSYFVAAVGNESGTFWYANLNGGQQVSLSISQSGAQLSGWYHESGRSSVNRHLTGTLSDRRALRLVSDDGTIELAGTLEWKPNDSIDLSQTRVILRLSVSAGLAGGTTRDFAFGDPY